jgi:hypothetical protein
VTAVAGLLVLGPVAPASATPAAANGQACTVLGTLADDLLVVQHARDVVCGLGGNDTIIGGDGDDVLDGGSGLNTCTADPADHQTENKCTDLRAPTADLASAVYVGATSASNAADRKVTMQIRLGDDVSGVASVFFDYRTTGAQSRLDSTGTPTADGVWTLTGTLPATITPGQWRVVGIYLTDRVGRQRIYDLHADGTYGTRDGSLSGTASLPAYTLTPC